MTEIAISVRRTDRVAELVRLMRPITRAPVHEISTAASGSTPVLIGDLFEDSVERQVTEVLDALRDAKFTCWVSLDGYPTDIEVVENMIRSGAASGREEQLLGFLESPELTFVERLQAHLELLLGPRWVPISALAAGMLVLLILVLVFVSGR